jgi:acetyl-CoA carboxylase carboxyl transferase subunit beta
LRPINFKDQSTERSKEPCSNGTGLIDGIPVALGLWTFISWEAVWVQLLRKITRLIEYATKKGLTVILICASGGARMQKAF